MGVCQLLTGGKVEVSGINIHGLSRISFHCLRLITAIYSHVIMVAWFYISTMFHPDLKSLIDVYNKGLLYIYIYVLFVYFQVRYVSISWTYRPPRWVRITASRVIVLIIVLCSIIINFSSFFEREPSPMSGQCHNFTLYEWRHSEFGRRLSYSTVQPWIVGFVCFMLPFSLSLLFATFHMIRTKFFQKVMCCKHNDSAQVEKKFEYNGIGYTSDTELVSRFNESQLDTTVTVVVMLYLMLEIPLAITTMYTDLESPLADLLFSSKFRYRVPTLIMTALSQLHSSINFLVYVSLSADFRKTFRRTCCCCTLGGGGINDDEYYEPMDCSILCPCPESPEPDDNVTQNSSADIKSRRSWIPNSKIKDCGDELWV